MSKSNRKASVHKKPPQKQNHLDVSVNASTKGNLQIRVIFQSIVQGASFENSLKILRAIFYLHWTIHGVIFLVGSV